MFWSVTYDGKPLDTTKHTYNQAFAIYALSAYYRLTGNPEALQTARQLFQIVEMHCRDAEGYGESYDRFWNPQSNEKLSENGVMAERTMNTLLHVFEGYSGLYQAAKSPEVEKELRALLDIWSEKMFDPEKRRQEVFFDRSYHSLIDLAKLWTRHRKRMAAGLGLRLAGRPGTVGEDTPYDRRAGRIRAGTWI